MNLFRIKCSYLGETQGRGVGGSSAYILHFPLENRTADSLSISAKIVNSQMLLQLVFSMFSLKAVAGKCGSGCGKGGCWGIGE